MRVEALVAGAKGLMQRVDAKMRATLPRQVRVTRTEGNSVWVKFLGDGANDPESKFPSTVAGVPPATMGWVVTLGGRKGLFVATGLAEFPPSPHNHDERYYTEAEVDAMIAAMPLPISFVVPTSTAGSFTRVETTSITGFGWTNSTTISVPAGTYRAVGIAVMPVARSVASGNIYAAVRLGGVVQEGPPVTVGTAGWGPTAPNVFFTAAVAFDTVITAGSNGVLVEHGVRGETTAGTTYLHRPQMTGTLTRIG